MNFEGPNNSEKKGDKNEILEPIEFEYTDKDGETKKIEVLASEEQIRSCLKEGEDIKEQTLPNGKKRLIFTGMSYSRAVELMEVMGEKPAPLREILGNATKADSSNVPSSGFDDEGKLKFNEDKEDKRDDNRNLGSASARKF